MAKEKSFMGQFVDFVREQGVVGLAVGLAIGTSAGATVKVLVDNLISPVVTLMTQGIKLENLTWNVTVGNGEAVFGWGAILSSVVTLLATALVIYWIVHVAKLDKLDKK
ncbi:MscL family protein [Candidatus Saccharibacteria bacterium]|jgi:large conductance mechanosensitive channel|nr:MscL family protein [Candidatus Saccharibacteria bacterium]